MRAKRQIHSRVRESKMYEASAIRWNQNRVMLASL